MMNDKIINSVTGQSTSPVLSEAELEAKAKQFYEEWLRDISAIKSYTEWLDYLSNKTMGDDSSLQELTDPDNPDSPRWEDMI